MTPNELSEHFEETFIREVDARTLREAVSRRDTARIYRELASAFRDRAAGLDAEADAEEEA